MVCKYSFIGEVPQPSNGTTTDFNPASSVLSERTCRTIPLKLATLLGETVFPAQSKNSLRLAYFTHSQMLSLCFPQHPSTEKFKLSCPASHCRLVRNEDSLIITMPLGSIVFSRAGPDSTAQYYDAPMLQAWVREVAQGSDLVFACTVLGNAVGEEGSGARLAHQFAEHVVFASACRGRCKVRRGSGGTGGGGGGGGGGEVEGGGGWQAQRLEAWRNERRKAGFAAP